MSGFIDAFFEVVDWDAAAENYQKTTANHE